MNSDGEVRESGGSKKWRAPASEETPGGMAVLSDGTVNTRRFSSAPETELSVDQWNKRTRWEVLREPTGHRVVVSRVVENVWKVHLLVGLGLAVLVSAGMVLFGSLPPLYGLVLIVLFAAICFGYLLYEQKIGGDGATTEEILELDSPLWAGVVVKARKEYLSQTKKGQKARYERAREKLLSRHEKAHEGEKKPPKFVEPEGFKERYVDAESVLTPEEVVSKTTALLGANQQNSYLRRLMKEYRSDPAKAEAMGRGVKGCACAACKVNAELGVVPALSGAEALRRRTRGQSEGVEKSLAAKALSEAGAVVDALAGQSKEGPSAAERERERVRRAEQARESLEREQSRREAEREKEEAKAAALREAELEAESRARVRGDARGGSGAKKGLLIAGAALLLVVVGAVGYLALSGSGEDSGEKITLPEMTSEPTSQSTSVAPTTTEEAPPTGTEKPGQAVEFGPQDPGDQKTGAAVIAAYDHAYYVLRDPDAVLRFYAPGADSGDRTTLKNAIEANPKGTTYRLKITPVIPGEEYDVLLTVNWPGRAPLEAKQKFFTTYTDGKYYVLRSE